MHRSFLILISACVLSSCGTMKPQGVLGDVIEGKIFEHSPRDSAAEKKSESAQRALNQQIPPLDAGGDVNFRIPL